MRSTPRLLVLDGLRGVAALAVLVFHCHLWIGSWVGHGYLAVDFFFVLSGVVLERAYGRRLRAGWSPLAFLRARLARVYRLYAVGILIGLIAYAARVYASPIGWLESTFVILSVAGCAILMLPVPFVSGNASAWILNPPAWSLFFELVANGFYGVFARRLTDRALWVTIALGAVALASSALAWHGLKLGQDLGTLAGGLARVWFSFFAGIMIERLHERGLFERLPSLGLLPSAMLLGSVLILPQGDPTGLVDLGLVLVFMPALVSMSMSREGSRREQVVCRALGALSYPLYVLHIPVMNVIDLAMPDAGAKLSQGCLAAALLVVASVLLAGLAAAWDRERRTGTFPVGETATRTGLAS